MTPTSEPTIKTEELSASDILEVHNVVRAMRAEAPSADRTAEVDALDILAAEDLVEGQTTAKQDVVVAPIAIASAEVIEEKGPSLPPIATPPRRSNEPTKIIHRDLIQRVERALAAKRTRSILMLAAALGTWGFFASLSIGGVYGISRIAAHFGSHEAPIALSAPPSAPASEQIAAIEASTPALAPLLKSDAVSSSREDGDSQISRMTASRSDEIFRRPSKTQVGVLRLPASVHGLLVDGTPERVSGGSLILACGDHRVRAPHSTARVVRVPCGKTVTL